MSDAETADAPPCKRPKVAEENTDSASKGEESKTKDLNLVSDTLKAYARAKPATEDDVGITEYISQHSGFSGIIKQRFSDFHVNELTSDGDVVTLTDISVPKCDEQPDKPVEDIKSVTISTEQMDQLKELAEGGSGDSEVIIQVGDDKLQRTAIHKTIKKLFPELDTATVDREGAKCIRAFCTKKGVGRGQRAPSWPSGRPNFCWFVLYKENKDTMQAVNRITKCLRLKPSAIKYAGTKDKRGKTCQLCAVYRVNAKKLFGLNKGFQGIVLGNFSYRKENIDLGDLRGNHFRIVLRDMTGTTDQVEQGMTSLKENGFINYYGMQRFGTTGIPTHHIGRNLLLSKWDDAIDLILIPRWGVNDDTAAARETWLRSRDPAEALKQLGRYQCLERYLLEGLKTFPPTDRLNALNRIPRNMRLMYIHAYQSYIWNRMVSHRLKTTGLKLVVGDLVVPGECDTVEVPDAEAEKERASEDRPKPIVITEDNISCYTALDLVMPLPGYDVTLPSNSTAQAYVDLLAEDGLSLEALRHTVKNYALSGAYRKVFVKPTRVSWQAMRYDDPTETLLLSDFDKLNGETLPAASPDGRFSGLMMEFSLPSSCYATMAIREVLKQPTSAAFHSNLSASAHGQTDADT